MDEKSTVGNRPYETTTDREVTPVEDATRTLRDVQGTVREQLEELAHRLKPVMREPYNGELAVKKEAAGPTPAAVAASEHVRELGVRAAVERQTSEILTHLLKNLEV